MADKGADGVFGLLLNDGILESDTTVRDDGTVTAGESFPTWAFWVLIGQLVVMAILTIVGSQLWKKAQELDPPSEKNPVSFFLKSTWRGAPTSHPAPPGSGRGRQAPSDPRDRVRAERVRRAVPNNIDEIVDSILAFRDGNAAEQVLLHPHGAELDHGQG